VRKKDDRKNYKAVRVVFRAAFTWIIIAAAVIPALIFPQFKLPAMTGKHKVATAVFTYTDNSRIETFKGTGGRRVNVEFWYPEDADGRYPLVVFSHGAFGVKTSNTSTFMDLASNGYVVCSIDHPYHSMYTRYSDGSSAMADRSFIQEVLDANNGIYNDADVYELEQKWLKLRADDMDFVIDTIIRNAGENSSDRVYQLIDTGKIGLFGHSLGGAASAKLGRERKEIDAVINLDADLLGEEVGFADGKPVINKEIYPVPMLGIYSETMKDLMASAAAANPDVVIPQKLISATAHDSFRYILQAPII
jgi:predicted dienelactone hydrolase